MIFTGNNELRILSHICSQYIAPIHDTEKTVLNLVFHFSQYHIIFSRDEAYVHEGLSSMQNLEYQGSMETFIAILKNQKDPFHAYRDGEFYITGNRLFFFSLGKSFNFHSLAIEESGDPPRKMRRGPFGLPREFSYLLLAVTFLQIWMGWVLHYHSALSFGLTFFIYAAFGLYYLRTDRLTDTENFLLLYLGLGFFLFLFKSVHFTYYYHIYFIISLPVLFVGSFYSRKRDALSEYNSYNINGLEIFNREIMGSQRRAIIVWSMLWALMILYIYVSMYSSRWDILSTGIKTVISLLFCAVLLFNLFAINGFHTSD